MDGITFFVNIEPPEMRVFEIRGGRVFDIMIERDSRLLGDIYKGRVENILPGMDAAFVNVGLPRNVLIYAGDIGPVDRTADKPHIPPIEHLLRVGDELLVQVARPPVGNKGARVTARLSLPGRYTVLTTQADSVGVSRRIDNEEERSRLRRVADKLRPLDHGIIVRTEAEGVPEAELSSDIHGLDQQLHDILGRGSKARAPALLHRDLGLLGRLARDRMNDSVAAIVIDADDVFHAFHDLVLKIAPQFADRVRYGTSAEVAHGRVDFEAEIQRACDRVVQLPSGGCLVIDEAEALTAIDVNTSKFVGKNRLADTVLQTNLEAVEEVTRQLRLRDIGGVIVIDLIDMERTRDRIHVMNSLESALKHDRTRTRIVQLSPLGLVELTRRREGYSLRQIVQQRCPYCSGDGTVKTATTVAIDTRRRIRDMVKATPGTGVLVTLHPEVATALLGHDAEFVRALEATTEAKLFVRTDFSLHREASRIDTATPEDIDKRMPAIEPGAQFHLPSQPVLYPDTAPQFTVLQGMLMLLENLAEGEAGGSGDRHGAEHKAPAVVEVIERGQWYITGKVLVWHSPETG